MNITVKILVFLCINLIICALVASITSGHVLVRNQTSIVKIHSVSLQNFVCHRFNPSLLHGAYSAIGTELIEKLRQSYLLHHYFCWLLMCSKLGKS